MKTQAQTKYHDLLDYLMNDENQIYFGQDVKNEIKNKIEKLYDEHIQVKQKLNENGDFGLTYTTIGHDDSYPTKHIIWFHTQEDRDIVYEDYKKGKYYDSKFNKYLPYHDTIYLNFELGDKIHRTDI
jgi:hypothetical protein